MTDLRKIFAPENRGILLDVVVFFVNAGLMFALARLLAELTREAKADATAQAELIELDNDRSECHELTRQVS